MSDIDNFKADDEDIEDLDNLIKTTKKEEAP